MNKKKKTYNIENEFSIKLYEKIFYENILKKYFEIKEIKLYHFNQGNHKIKDDKKIA